MKRLLLATLVTLVALGGLVQARTGAWVDEVVFTEVRDPAAAVRMLAAGEIDMFLGTVVDRMLVAELRANPDLRYFNAFAGLMQIRLNHGGDRPHFTDGRLNPFGVPAIREAMNWLVDREHIVHELMGGLGVPKSTVLNTMLAGDAERYPHIVQAIDDYYAYDFARAKAIISDEMTKLGATKVDGKWTYQGGVVELKALVATELPFNLIGDYIAHQLEKVGFQVARRYAPGAELSPVWTRTDPREGRWSFNAGAWVIISPRDEGALFEVFYTPRGRPWPLFTPLNVAETMPRLDELSGLLARQAFTNMEEREALFEEILWLANRYANFIWLADRIGVFPARANTAAAACPAGGLLSATWPFTVQFQKDDVPQAGGTMRVGAPALLGTPWNPIAGAIGIVDVTMSRWTSDHGYMFDPRDMLIRPLRFERATVEVVEGLPTVRNVDHDWVSLRVVDEIRVPKDAWIDWDAKEQRFITVGEKFPDGLTARRMSRVYYPDNLFDTPLHDGSRISIADFILRMILAFDRGNPESAIFDETAAPGLRAFLAHFRGARIVSEDPLIIESYSDTVPLDAEHGVTHWFPFYDRGPGFWHTLALGIMAEANRELAFSKAKADLLRVEWTSYIAGPSLPVLARNLDQAIATGFIPYAPTLGRFITPDEARARYANIKAWYERTGHFWVASGPLYLARVHPVEKIVVMRRFEAYPYPADRWQFLVR